MMIFIEKMFKIEIFSPQRRLSRTKWSFDTFTVRKYENFSDHNVQRLRIVLVHSVESTYLTSFVRKCTPVEIFYMKSYCCIANGLHNVIFNRKWYWIDVMNQSIDFTKTKAKFSMKLFGCWENHDQETGYLIQTDWNAVIFFLKDGVRFKINWSIDFNSIYCSIQSS